MMNADAWMLIEAVSYCVAELMGHVQSLSCSAITDAMKRRLCSGCRGAFSVHASYDVLQVISASQVFQGQTALWYGCWHDLFDKWHVLSRTVVDRPVR